MSAPPEQVQLDIVTVAVVAVTAVAGGEIARYAGPYMVIVAAALTGGVIALMRKQTTLLQALAFLSWITAMSVLLTGACAALAVHLLGLASLQADSRYLLVPISGGIAAVGHDWPAVATWVGNLIKRVITRRLGASE